MSGSSSERVRLDGKFFRLATERFHVRGVTYGTFAKNKAGDPFPEPARVAADFALIRELGANVLRVYDVPPRWVIDAAQSHGLRLFVTVPWASSSCFLDSRSSQREARTAVTTAVRALAGNPAIFAYALANEIPPDIVRWSGVGKVAAFLDELVAAAHDADPSCLCTYGNYPSTEFLQPRQLDFITFNVFLHERRALADYLPRLQLHAEGRPLVLGECGADSAREGLERQAEILSDTLAAAVDAGFAGSVVFSFTDDWVRAGVRVDDWALGLTTVERTPKPAFSAVQQAFHVTRPPLVTTESPAPRVTVVVASYNAAPTLRACLDSLLRLDYPNFEILVVDDGSTDETPEITAKYPQVRTLRQRTNFGLSTARNLGIRAATGEIIAFTDADCRVDPDWLHYLVHDLRRANLAGIGGPNLLPPDDTPMATAVMASPGGPMHVLLDARTAEHIPGCNMAFWRWALDAIEGFDPIFWRAGDDVDVCWRIQRRGWRLGFSPAAFVWHYRRSTVGAYFSQQSGYGDAEALLLSKHPERFNAIGGAQWQGQLTHAPALGLPWTRPVIYHGRYATGLFQTLYAPPSDGVFPVLTSLEYHVLVALPLAILAVGVPWLWPVAVLAWLIPPMLCLLAAARVPLAPDRRRWWSRAVIAYLHYAQPIVRGLARHTAQFRLHDFPESTTTASLEAESQVWSGTAARERAFWSAQWRERHEWIEQIVAELEERGWSYRRDQGWGSGDLEVFGSRWASLSITTVAEANRDRSQTLRCRLRPQWTLMARLVFWGTLAVIALLFGLFHVNWRGLWIPVVVQGALAWFLQRQGRAQQCRFGALLEDVARSTKLTPTESGVSN